MLEGSGVIAFNTPPIAVPAILNGEISDNEVKESFKVFIADYFGLISALALVPASASKSESPTVLPGNEPLAKPASFAALVADGSADIPKESAAIWSIVPLSGLANAVPSCVILFAAAWSIVPSLGLAKGVPLSSKAGPSLNKSSPILGFSTNFVPTSPLLIAST